MNSDKKYYQNIGELDPESLRLQRPSAAAGQPSDFLSLLDGRVKMRANRRNFLKLAGFSAVLGTVLNSCEKPIHKAIPYLIKPEEITPGASHYYATSFFDGEEYCSLLVKSRDGRPIKVEGNPMCVLTQGGTSARVQASVLSLYDDDRYKEPMQDGRKLTWEEADAAILKKLNEVKTSGGRIVLLTSTVISPTAGRVIQEFLQAWPNAQHVTYDTVSCSGMLLANEQSFGIRALPSYDFSKAELIVGFEADFLGTWISPVEYTAQYAAGRKLKDPGASMSRHVQFETGMSLTGSNADTRYAVKPSEIGICIDQLYRKVASGLSGSPSESPVAVPEHISQLAADLLQSRGKSLVVCGSNDTAIQLQVNAINAMLENYGNTIDLRRPSYVRKADDREMIQLVDDLSKGNVAALVIVNTNPAYHYPEQEKFLAGIKQADLAVSLSVHINETAALCQFICPASHYLESWGDAEPVKGYYALQQPLINPIFNTRQWEESLLAWAGNSMPFRDYLRDYWQQNLFPAQLGKAGFKDFWVHTLQKGLFKVNADMEQHPVPQSFSPAPVPERSDSTELHLYQSVALATGRHANNPWLQEMPDPVTKAVWENYAAVSPRFAAEHGLEDYDMITLQENISLPVLVQPGQAYGTISIALGYGRKVAGKVAEGLGVNVFTLAAVSNGALHWSRTGTSFQKTGGKHTIARSQVYGSLDGRPIVRETTLEEYRKKPDAGNELHQEIEKKHVSLYDYPVYDGFHWGLSVDLNSCTGCGACLIACQAENNIPVVGKTEVAKFRIMHWIRIDRYYAGDPENPEVVHQPVMCMQCDHAPCENVCPVSATPHNNEGLNQVAYTRCIGTKYCINNCPYKVRKFNWFQYAQNPSFDYHANSDLGRLVLNPDVTVRERGVVEKCSFCAQRIQEKKLQAKLENRPLNGEEVQPACVQACPAKALTFGDLNNPGNAVTRNVSNERNYYLLEELHTLPSVGYLTKIRNRNTLQG
jgi:molybdopterin-containing oxidoreductase family iron-sulfur binding subunit